MLAVSEYLGQKRASCPRTAVDWGLQTSKLLLSMLYWPGPSSDPEKASSKYTLRFKNPKKPSAYGPIKSAPRLQFAHLVPHTIPKGQVTA